MLRQAIPAALITTALALSACGGDNDADHARSTFSGFYRALASPHPVDACRLMTDAGKRRLAEAAGRRTCDDVVTEFAAEVWFPDEREALRHVRAGSMVFADGHHKAIVPEDQILMPQPWKRRDNGRPAVLINHDGKWLIEDLGT